MSKIKTLINNLLIIGLIIIVHHSAEAAYAHDSKVADDQQQKMILYYVNAYREKHHLSLLKMNKVISQEAAKHSRDMASHAMKFGHDDFNGRIKRLYQHIPKCNGGAENIAYYNISAKKLVENWISSPGHRRNIEGNYNLTGIGIAHDKKGWAYYTQIFLRSDGATVG